MQPGDVFAMFEEMTALWPSFSVAPERLETTITMWSEVLADYSPEQCHKALLSMAGRSRFAPSIAEVIHAIEVNGWTVEEAVDNCRPWALYANQAAFANGSGYSPTKPRRGLPPKVIKIFNGVNPAEEGWEERFRWAWKDSLPR